MDSPIPSFVSFFPNKQRKEAETNKSTQKIHRILKQENRFLFCCYSGFGAENSDNEIKKTSVKQRPPAPTLVLLCIVIFLFFRYSPVEFSRKISYPLITAPHPRAMAMANGLRIQRFVIVFLLCSFFLISAERKMALHLMPPPPTSFGFRPLCFSTITP